MNNKIQKIMKELQKVASANTKLLNKVQLLEQENMTLKALIQSKDAELKKTKTSSTKASKKAVKETESITNESNAS